MKPNILATLTFSLVMGLSTSVLAQELPDIQKPAELSSGEFSEGTITQLSEADVTDFIPWAQNAQKVLQDALTESKNMPITERVSFVEKEIKSAVKGSGNKQYQMLMRFALNRGLLLVDILNKEANQNDKGIIENQLDIFSRSIDLAIKFHESDLAYQRRVQSGSDVVNVNYAQFGQMLASSFFEASKSIMDASAQHQVMYKTFEMLNWDLVQDQYAKNYSEVIVEVYKTLQNLPESASSDQESIQHTRSLNYLLQNIEGSLPVFFSHKIEVGRGKKICGNHGSILQRVQDCGVRPIEGFVLVTKDVKGKEIYKDFKSGLVWGYRLSNMDYNTAKNACESFDELASSNITWRLPTLQEFLEAHQNGVRALPGMDSSFWALKNSYTLNTDKSVLVDGKKTNHHGHGRITSIQGVRCVGHISK